MMDTDLADVSKKSTITPFTIGDFAESLFSSSVVCLFHPVRLDADVNKRNPLFPFESGLHAYVTSLALAS